MSQLSEGEQAEVKELWKQYEDWEEGSVRLGSSARGGKQKQRQPGGATSAAARAEHRRLGQEARKKAARERIVLAAKHFPPDNPERERFIEGYITWLNQVLISTQPYTLNPSEVVVERMRAKQKAGGQNVNKTSSAIRVKHSPTNIFVRNEETPDQARNEAVARGLLEERISNHLNDWQEYLGKGKSPEADLVRELFKPQEPQPQPKI